jgi:hypothetical protein
MEFLDDPEKMTPEERLTEVAAIDRAPLARRFASLVSN